MTTPHEDAAFLARNAADCLPAGELERKLALQRPLRVKLGLDPTSPDLHLGHTVVLQKLREFQDSGHLVVLIVGDYTARVGDPSGRSSTRLALSGAAIDANAATYREQAFTVLDADRVEVRRNSEWLDMDMERFFGVARTTTVAQLLERDDFARRYAAHQPISVLEIMYPLLQAYDSVAVRADVELGGTDQKFNLLLGRDLQRAYGQPEQVALTMPILVGTDGERKMSKSLDNAIGVTDAPDELYGRVLSVPDVAMAGWYALLLGEPPPPDLSPRDAKHALAHRLTARFHGAAQADRAAEHFARVHVAREAPEYVPDLAFTADEGTVHLPALLAAPLGVSRSQVRQLLAQGAVRLDGRPLAGDELDVRADRLDGRTLQVGRRRFWRLCRTT